MHERRKKKKHKRKLRDLAEAKPMNQIEKKYLADTKDTRWNLIRADINFSPIAQSKLIEDL